MNNITFYENKERNVQVQESTTTFMKREHIIPQQHYNLFSVPKQNLIQEQVGQVFLLPSILTPSDW